MEDVLSGTYDAVIVQAVIHHLADTTYKRTCAQVRTAMAECLRILKPGATLLIMESTVAPWFAAIERFVYPLMQAFFAICRFWTRVPVLTWFSEASAGEFEWRDAPFYRAS